MIAAFCCSVTVLGGWTSQGGVVVPRGCTAADTRQRAFLVTEDPQDASRAFAYERARGPARAIVRVGGRT